MTFSGTTVFLPWPTRAVSQYLEYMKKLAAKESLTFPTTCECSWPTSFEALVDHNWEHMSSPK